MENELLRGLLWVVHFLGWTILVASTFQLDHLDFLGLRDGLVALTGGQKREIGFCTPFLYRLVRHPLMTGLLMALWSVPTMTASGLAIVAGFTVYVFVGLVYEERDLVAEFGDRYREYRKTTPSLLPIKFGK